MGATILRREHSEREFAMPTKVSQTYRPTVKLTPHRGWYRVQSGSDPNAWYTTTANSCTCPSRKPCKHQRFIRALNVAFFVKKDTAPTPMRVSSTGTVGMAALQECFG
jgi:hypothetical protein